MAWFVPKVGVLAVVLGAFCGTIGQAEDRLTIYIDADYTHMPAPAEAIEAGLRSALISTGADAFITIRPRNHRANARRSFDNIRDAVADQTAIAVVGGMHSPPYLIHGRDINAARMPLLIPWAAGGLATRFDDGDANWIFRLSVDDTKAGGFLLDSAMASGCENPGLVVVDNPWGKGNAGRIQGILADRGAETPLTVALPVDVGMESATSAAMDVQSAGSDCVILVSGLALGSQVITALAENDTPPRVFSHWGILGNTINDHITPRAREAVSLAVLGTCGLLEAQERPEVHNAAKASARTFMDAQFQPDELVAVHGFYHAHDLGLLIVEAVREAQTMAGWDEGITGRRTAFRGALYGLENEIEGLLKTYSSPFRPNTPEDRDGHEALSGSDLCLTEFDHTGLLRPFRGEGD